MMFGAVLAGKHGPGTSSEPPARERREPRRLEREDGSDTITSVTDKSRQQQRALREWIYDVCSCICIMRTDGLRTGIFIAP